MRLALGSDRKRRSNRGSATSIYVQGYVRAKRSRATSHEVIVFGAAKIVSAVRISASIKAC